MRQESEQEKENVSQENEYEDLRFIAIDTKKIFEISKEDAKRVQIFIELGRRD